MLSPNSVEASKEDQEQRIQRLKEKIVAASIKGQWLDVKNYLTILQSLSMYLDPESSKWLKDTEATAKEYLAIPDDIQRARALLEDNSLEAKRISDRLLRLEPENSEVKQLSGEVKGRLNTQIKASANTQQPSSEVVDFQQTTEEISEALSLAESYVVFVIGNDIYSESDSQAQWSPQDNGYLPSDQNLGRYLAFESNTQEVQVPLNQVIQRLFLQKGEPWLRRTLKPVFENGYKPNKLHRLPALLSEHPHYPKFKPIVICQTFDDLIIKSFIEADKAFDLFRPDVEDGHLHHCHYDGESLNLVDAIKDSTDSTYELGDYPVIIMVNGYVDSGPRAFDNTLLTEDSLIQSLNKDIFGKLPTSIKLALQNDSSYLFMGSNLEGWYTRGIFADILTDKPKHKVPPRWVITSEVDSYNLSLWESFHVEVIEASLDDFIDVLHTNLGLDSNG